MWGLLLRVVCFPVRLPWIKLIFHWQLFISWKWHLGYKWGLVSTSSLIWGTPPDAYLCGPLVWCHKVSVSSCVYQSYCVYRALFPWCCSSIRSLTLFLLPLPHSFLRPEGRGLLGDVPFRGECSMASHFLHIVWLGVFFSHVQKEDASLMVAEQRHNLWVSQNVFLLLLCPCFFNRTDVFGFLLCPCAT